MAPDPNSQGTSKGQSRPWFERPGPYPWGGWKMSKSKEHIHLRFQAVVIASQLPDNRAEALLVLDYARHMVLEFLDDSSAPSSGITVRDNFTVP